TLNKALLDGFLRHQQDSNVKRSHLFNGRYENIYLTSTQIPELASLLEEACEHASSILGTADLQAGCWFNYMPPGAVTTVHSHDDYDELLSGVYYVSVPQNSGNLIIHQGNRQHVISPQEGMFVFFAPDAVHEVSENLSASGRLSIGINFGRRRIGDE
ncbi:MAG: putative 2OG-Fe(II) oxygenase, partial [Gammaproteobacteria bacterium]